MGQFSPDSSITGAAITGLTNPTYTLASDLAPDSNSRQYVITALGGTQTDVRASTAGDPFTLTVRKQPYKSLPARNPVNGSYGNVPRNRVEMILRKGMEIDSDGTLQTGIFRLISELPAGCEQNDVANIRAAVSFLIGLLYEEADDYDDSLISGVW
jgi:hypothetical protein